MAANKSKIEGRKRPAKTANAKSGCGCGCGEADQTAVRPEDMKVLNDFVQDRGAGTAETMIGTPLVEDGFDVQTHGGGSLEYAEGFDLREPMIRGLGETAPVPLPDPGIPMACSLHFQDGPMETVCGHDGRVQVGEDGTPPWRMICQLIITMGNGATSRGTGWFISPRTVMTAGHCVHSSRNGGWVRSVEVIPAMSGHLRPFGSSTSVQFHSVGGWVNRQEQASDYGCIILPEGDGLGLRTGWFGFAALPDAALKDLLANNSGYPGDKSFGTQWYNAGRIIGTEAQRLAYMFDTAPGQSGSPTWRYDKTQKRRHVIGIHNYGGCANRSTRINSGVFGVMKRWKALGM